jgi:hypothetical protein
MELLTKGLFDNNMHPPQGIDCWGRKIVSQPAFTINKCFLIKLKKKKKKKTYFNGKGARGR